MKISERLVLTAVGILLTASGLQSSSAQDHFNVVLSATCISTNQAGGSVYRPISTEAWSATAPPNRALQTWAALSWFTASPIIPWKW